jgi:hypothetical protein
VARQQRFAEAGPDGLLRDKTRMPGKPPVGAATVAHVVALACGDPPPDATHWTGRAGREGHRHPLRSVQRIWEAQQLRCGQKDQRQEAASSRRYTGIATARRCASGGVHSRPFAGGMAAVTIVLTTNATLAIGSVAEIVRTKAKLDMNKPFRIYRSTNKQHLSGCPTKPSSLRGDAAERRG